MPITDSSIDHSVTLQKRKSSTKDCKVREATEQLLAETLMQELDVNKMMGTPIIMQELMETDQAI